ncbi:MAG: phosphate acyltransferase PlsX [Candidatus Eremiobacteraeota bacterium]|nr:phosphate acyltransferase PlsX [Candidatus Eremiobacteraeota bacterium]
MRVAIDAMGGDNAPDEIVAGAVLARRDGLGEMVLVGDEPRIAKLLAQHRAKDIEIVHAPSAVAMDANPSQVVRTSDKTSLGIAINLVREEKADAVVSAGNSGAFLAIALIRLRTIPGIARPAIAVVFPARDGPVIVLDSGANVDCKPEWLAQFGLMGSAYAKAALGIENPRVAIVSVGEERVKGNAQTIEAAGYLDRMPVNFIGNVEGKDILFNHADVCVTDGFVGNVILKLSEGAAALLGDIVLTEIKRSSPLVKLGALMVKPALRRVRDRVSYDSFGGAPLLGLRGNCIVAHGRANRIAVRSAIRAAVAEVREDVVGRIGEMMASLDFSDAREA